MIWMYRMFLYFAEFDLALAKIGGNSEWIAQASADVAYWQGVVDREAIQKIEQH